MSEAPTQINLVLIRRQGDGTVEWLPLEAPARIEATQEADYALIDRSTYEAPASLVVKRDAGDLALEVNESQVLVLTGFFDTFGVAFFPTTDIAGGVGPFSEAPLTPYIEAESDAGGEQIVWSAQEAAEETVVVTAPATGTGGPGGPAIALGGLAVGGLGLALAGGGGGGGGGGSSGVGSSSSGTPRDTTAPTVTSGSTAEAIDENSGAGQLIYTATASDASVVTWTLQAGDDASAFAIDASSGQVTLLDNPDFETQSSYSFTVVATDAAGNRSSQLVALTINDADEAPRITSGSTAEAIDENSGTGQLIYTATASDEGPVTWALGPDGDASAFSIDSNSGAVTLLGDPDFEAQSSYSFTVIATDALGSSSAQTIGLSINDVDENAPVITSGDTATPINENTGAGQLIYSATATDESALTWALEADGDASAFAVDAESGAVTLLDNPDFETQSSYSFTVVAIDAAGNRSTQTVTLSITDTDDSAPFITSGATAEAIDENSGPGQLIYTATAIDEGALSWTLAPDGDASAFAVDAESGAVTLLDNPDFETQSSYSFTVIATDADGNRSTQAVSLAINDVDENAPVITSGATATPLDENSGAGQLVYSAVADDDSALTWAIAPGGDAAAFAIDAVTGAVTLLDDPDFETQSSYSFTVVATDALGNSSTQAVTLAITDVDENAPVITSGATATPLDENSGAGQLVYGATADDDSALTWAIAPGGDAAAFAIDAVTGEVTLLDNPDFETQSSYSFTVVATDALGNSSTQAVTLAITDTDDAAPFITSGATAEAVDENSGTGQLVYSATADDDSALTWALAPQGDAAAFSIDGSSGDVTLLSNPDFETQSSYSFTVVATDALGNSSTQAVTLAINDVDENAPIITSGATATPLDENSGANQTIYTAAATDESAIEWTLQPGADASAFAIDGDTGAVTLLDDPDFEDQLSYGFTVVATDALGNSSTQAVTLAINDVDENAPIITSGSVAEAIDENSGARQIVYDGDATDESAVTWGLLPGDNASAFRINANNGVVRLIRNPDFEDQPSYSFTVVATDALGNRSTQAVTLAINDVDENAPVITSGATATPLDENSGANQTIYTAAATDESAIEWTLQPGADASAFAIDGDTGAVTLLDDPDFEDQPSYSFTVVATDALGNSSTQAVTLAINDIDEDAPIITSGATAKPLDENSGTDQLVYSATATDASTVTWTLAPGDDADAFEIDANSGAVTLLDDPDFEDQPSYSFTVVATDTEGNRSTQQVSLAINDVDETPPAVIELVLSSAVGAQNDSLNAGDTVRVTVTMSEATEVDTAGGVPRLALAIGASTVLASYASGSGTSTLTFEYAVQAGDNDDNGISIPANALNANGGTLTDASGNPADLDHGPVPANDAFLVDTTAPSLIGSTPADNATDVPVSDNLVLTFSEDVQAGDGNIRLSNGTDSRTISINDGSQVTVSGNQLTLNPVDDLEEGSRYNLQIDAGAVRDLAGNDYAGISDSTTLDFDTETSVDTSIVVFDLAQGASSSHSGRTFQGSESYTIYILVNSGTHDLSTAGAWGTWSGASQLGSDDRVVLVGSGAAVQGPAGPVSQVAVTAASVAWRTSLGANAGLLQGQAFSRREGADDDSVLLFGSSPASGFFGGQGGLTTSMYLTSMPAGILTSQGLA